MFSIRNFSVLIVLVCMLAVSSFQLSLKRNSFSVSKISSHDHKIQSKKVLFLSGNEFERETPATAASDEKADEDPEAIAKRERGGISQSMKDRLKREMQSQGADPDFSTAGSNPILGNPILLVSLVIGVLVIVGGKGYFY